MTSRHSKVTALKGFTDTLRGRSGPDYSTAKVQVPARGEEYEWRDYVRGKDLARHLKDKQDILDELTKPQAAGRDQSDQISDLVIKLVHEKLLIPADRKFKKPKPGKKKLVKWPRTLKPVPGAAWDEELFYAFSYDKPTGPMFYLLAVVVALCVLAVPLFPLAPYPVRLAVLYALSGLLSVLLGTMLLRYVVWAAVWLVSGAHFWLLPNMMSDDVPITQLFWPLISFTPHSREDKLSSFLVRGGITLLLGAAGYGLYVASPDAATVKAGVQDAKDSVLAYFVSAFGCQPMFSVDGIFVGHFGHPSIALKLFVFSEAHCWELQALGCLW
eukprot:GHRR01016037.1.p1 GENE.GHRR01016037.1~~GHRR01016037.1.p1  ORF type:complete len:328 (+),score=83.91 GHRR01016037.1:452-1435(+)